MDMNEMNPQPTFTVEEEPKKSKVLAIISMICGILSLVLCCVPAVPVILAIVAIALGIVSLVKKQGGKGMVIAGFICAGFGLFGGLTYSSIWAALFADMM